jgi:hypothetical protein
VTGVSEVTGHRHQRLRRTEIRRKSQACWKSPENTAISQLPRKTLRVIFHVLPGMIANESAVINGTTLRNICAGVVWAACQAHGVAYWVMNSWSGRDMSARKYRTAQILMTCAVQEDLIKAVPD